MSDDLEGRPRSHGPAKGASPHGPDCQCTRCRGFQPGNEHAFGSGNAAAVKHAAYAVLQLSPRAEAIADWIRSSGEYLSSADEPAVQTLALTLAQLERAAGVLGEVDEAIKRGDDVDVYLGRIESRARLSQDARRWADSARRFMDDLGLTPAGRAQLEAALTPPGIPAHEVAEFCRAVLGAALEFVERSRSQEFLQRFDQLVAPVVGALPPAERDGDGEAAP